MHTYTYCLYHRLRETAKPVCLPSRLSMWRGCYEEPVNCFIGLSDTVLCSQSLANSEVSHHIILKRSRAPPSTPMRLYKRTLCKQKLLERGNQVHWMGSSPALLTQTSTLPRHSLWAPTPHLEQR